MLLLMEPGIVNRVLGRAKELGISKAKLAERIHILPQSITKWITTGSINIRHLVPLSRVLGVSLEWLLTGKTSTGPAIDADAVAHIVSQLRKIEVAVDSPLPEEKFGQLVALIYEEALGDGAPNEASIKRLVALAS